MDPIWFDRLAKTLGGAVSRRGALAALVSLTGIAGGAESRKERRRSEKTKHRNGQYRGRGRRQAPRRERAEAAACCGGGACVPGPGKNLQKCCFQRQDLTGKNFKGANLGSANFSQATLMNANLQGANAGKACFVDATLTGTRMNGSTNLDGAIFCRTQTDTGENNSGCDLGTLCCPTCDEDNLCDLDEVCCNGRCVPGNCCGNGEQSTCDSGDICCDNTCVTGNCCAAAGCPVETCQRRSCRVHQCVYEPVVGETGPRCQTVCCEDEQGDPVCCDGGATSCRPNGGCGCPQDRPDECDGRCVDVQTDPDHCGECGNACAAGETCQGGQCGVACGNDFCPIATEVCDNGSCRTCDVCGSGCLFTTLAAAVSDPGTLDGDTIRLCPGRYHTINAQINKDLTIIGVGAGDDPATDTILDAGGIGRVLFTALNVAVEIRDVRITGGAVGIGNFGGGIFNQSGTTLRLVGVNVVGNQAESGGGIDNDGTLTLENGSRMEGNAAVSFGGGIHNARGTTTLEAGSVVTGNTAGVGPGLGGGGVFEFGGTVNVADNTIVTGNTPNNCRPEGAIPNCVD